MTVGPSPKRSRKSSIITVDVGIDAPEGLLPFELPPFGFTTWSKECQTEPLSDLLHAIPTVTPMQVETPIVSAPTVAKKQKTAPRVEPSEVSTAPSAEPTPLASEAPVKLKKSRKHSEEEAKPSTDAEMHSLAEEAVPSAPPAKQPRKSRKSLTPTDVPTVASEQEQSSPKKDRKAASRKVSAVIEEPVVPAAVPEAIHDEPQPAVAAAVVPPTEDVPMKVVEAKKPRAKKPVLSSSSDDEAPAVPVIIASRKKKPSPDVPAAEPVVAAAIAEPAATAEPVAAVSAVRGRADSSSSSDDFSAKQAPALKKIPKAKKTAAPVAQSAPATEVSVPAVSAVSAVSAVPAVPAVSADAEQKSVKEKKKAQKKLPVLSSSSSDDEGEIGWVNNVTLASAIAKKAVKTPRSSVAASVAGPLESEAGGASSTEHQEDDEGYHSANGSSGRNSFGAKSKTGSIRFSGPIVAFEGLSSSSGLTSAELSAKLLAAMPEGTPKDLVRQVVFDDKNDRVLVALQKSKKAADIGSVALDGKLGSVLGDKDKKKAAKLLKDLMQTE